MYPPFFDRSILLPLFSHSLEQVEVIIIVFDTHAILP